MGWKFQAHVLKPHRNPHIARLVCGRCGLIVLRNLLSLWCQKMGCNYTEHPGLKEACVRLVTEHQTRHRE